MNQGILSCLGYNCDGRLSCYDNSEERKRAKHRNSEITRLLRQSRKEESNRLKILLLGTGESGKSTITKQMRIIHINGFSFKDRVDKIADIRRNIKESIVVLLGAMRQMQIPFQNEALEDSRKFVLDCAGRDESNTSTEFLDHTERLWMDGGTVQCYNRLHEEDVHLIDSAKYFLDKLHEIKSPAYIPTDQDILRSRSLTTAIQQTEFTCREAGSDVKFCLYDVGGQQGERKKWIQVFDSVTAILFVADCSSFDQTLREDPSKNRLLDALENFEQVWNNRFLRRVSVLLFLNKIDILAEKVAQGRDVSKLATQFPDVFPDFDSFRPSDAETSYFLDTFPCGKDDVTTLRKSSRSKKSSRPEVDSNVIKTAIYIKHLFMKIVSGELTLKPRVTLQSRTWHDDHVCEYFYTCAIDTGNVQRVMKGCRTLLIRDHLKKYGIL